MGLFFQQEVVGSEEGGVMGDFLFRLDVYNIFAVLLYKIIFSSNIQKHFLVSYNSQISKIVLDFRSLIICSSTPGSF